ncbi:hypothetical protein FHG89_29255 [Micromonospora orduensis]|uniref:Uncharacterized protein n=1 Tax=Micromonospora orduensis TaxID=1420891 RepID=A0A5C4QEJ1_9ACTN|nr:hypothetical protein [Micromonospora orduensis]TNH22415.1 hypothetical protein FHG89_29255 [Micromonospora orduensis]
MAVREVASGDVLRLTRAASPQYVRPIVVRVIRVLDWPTYYGWLWIDAYELGLKGDAVARRTLFVLVEGLKWVSPAAPAPTVAVRGGVRHGVGAGS